MGNSATRPETINLLKDKFASYKGTPKDFKRIENELTEEDRNNLGEAYKIWRLGCMYEFLRSDKIDIQYNTSNIITEFDDKVLEVRRKAKDNIEDAVVDLLALYYSAKNTSKETAYANELINLGKKLPKDSPIKKTLDTLITTI